MNMLCHEMLHFREISGAVCIKQLSQATWRGLESLWPLDDHVVKKLGAITGLLLLSEEYNSRWVFKMDNNIVSMTF